MTGSIKSKHASADSSIFGILLMLGYLGFDGFTSTFQDKLFKASKGAPQRDAAQRSGRVRGGEGKGQRSAHSSDQLTQC